jgi:ribosomal protein S6--L-glutamate ligase
MNILILATAKNSLAVKRLTYEAKKRGHSVDVYNPLDLFLLISNSQTGYDRLYHAQGGKVTRLNIKDYDAVIARIGENTSYGAFLVEHLHKNLKIFSTNPAEGIRTATNQLKTLQLLSSHGILTPRTVYAQNPTQIQFLIDKIGGFPFVCKQTIGSGGSGVSLLDNRKTAVAFLQSLFKAKASVILQEYLPANGKDYRAIVIGDQVVACMQRSATRGDFRANLKQNGKGQVYQLSEEEKQLAVRACRATGLYTAGVDLIKSGGRTFAIEINANWGWESEKITGVNYSELLIKFCEQNYQKKIPERNSLIDYQKQLAEAQSQNEELAKLVSRSNQQLRLLTGDKYLKDVYQKAKGNKISYKNRDNQTKVLKVEHMHDLFQIMKDSFLIK